MPHVVGPWVVTPRGPWQRALGTQSTPTTAAPTALRYDNQDKHHTAAIPGNLQTLADVGARYNQVQSPGAHAIGCWQLDHACAPLARKVLHKVLYRLYIPCWGLLRQQYTYCPGMWRGGCVLLQGIVDTDAVVYVQGIRPLMWFWCCTALPGWACCLHTTHSANRDL